MVTENTYRPSWIFLVIGFSSAVAASPLCIVLRELHGRFSRDMPPSRSCTGSANGLDMLLHSLFPLFMVADILYLLDCPEFEIRESCSL